MYLLNSELTGGLLVGVVAVTATAPQLQVLAPQPLPLLHPGQF